MLLITSKATDMSYIVQAKVSKQHKLQFIAIYRHQQVLQYRLWSFQGGDIKLERFLAKSQLYSNEITKF